jgi:demethoxyubiquinone hydroxylase (CLK1/Coq7/Cat5 family)
LKRKLDEVSSIKNVVNRNLQEDLRYERELNDKLRAELDRFQREKESMLNKLREQEATREDMSRETN